MYWLLGTLGWFLTVPCAFCGFTIYKDSWITPTHRFSYKHQLPQTSKLQPNSEEQLKHPSCPHPGRRFVIYKPSRNSLFHSLEKLTVKQCFPQYVVRTAALPSLSVSHQICHLFLLGKLNSNQGNRCIQVFCSFLYVCFCALRLIPKKTG